jgi:hypothetical protein
MEKSTESKISTPTPQSGKKTEQPSLTDVIRRLPRASLSLSKSDVAEMAKNIAGRSGVPTNADKKNR